MRRQQALQRQLRSFAILGAAVNAMKSLSAHHLRTARTGLAAARAYRDGINALIASAGIGQLPPAIDRPALLLVAADLGLCGSYNARLVAGALDEHRRLGAVSTFCIGRRPLVAFRRAAVPVARSYPAATSVGGLTNLLLTLADDVLDDYLNGTFTTLHVVSARFDGVGAFTPVSTQVLPITAPHSTAPPVTPRYVGLAHFTGVAVREYLYSTLFGLLLDALASEHGTRLVSTQSAGEWLDGRVADVSRQLSNVRRESGTQEVLEVAAGARQRRRSREYRPKL